ncbi:MAG: hypothetical protein JNG89_11880 [Planctomycetaceae bacterium]|nr:hypothetical protein [Planctomycetaceae bacterium]
MQACSMPPADRRRQIQRVGKDLMQHYGRKKYYTVDEVKQANLRQCISLDFWCWSHAMFNSHHDFDALHLSLGEACNYASMKSDMLSAVSGAVDATSWFDFDFDLSWIEFPDLDWSIFDIFDVDL